MHVKDFMIPVFMKVNPTPLLNERYRLKGLLEIRNNNKYYIKSNLNHKGDFSNVLILTILKSLILKFTLHLVQERLVE